MTSSHSSSHSNSYSNSHGNSHSNSHTNHGNHANSVSVTGSISRNHSVTAGTTSITSADAYLARYGATSSLTKLISAAREARNSLNTPSSTTSPPSIASATTPTGLTQLLNYSGGKAIIYPYSTSGISMDITYNNNGTSGHASTGGTLTNTETSPIANKSVHANTSTTGYHCNTAQLQSAYMNKTFPDGNINISSGQRITKNTLSSILNIINKGKVTTSATSSPLSYKATGSTKYTYSNSHGNSHSNSHTNSHSNSHTSSSTSSMAAKQDISNIDFKALDKIIGTNIVHFRYLDTYGDPSIDHYGFIAENTDKVFSTLYKDRMDYTNCIGLLFKAIQELIAEISDMKIRIKNLEEKHIE